MLGRSGDFGLIERVDGNAMSLIDERLNVVANLSTRRCRITTEIDDIGALFG